MVSCAVRGCRMDSRRTPGPRTKLLKFYSFPKNPELQLIWDRFCDSPKQLNYKTARICSRHFEKKYHFKRPIDIALGLSCPVYFRNLLEGAIPTVNGPPKDGEENPSLSDDEESIATIDFAEANPEYSDTNGEAPRYIFSGEIAARMIEADRRMLEAAEAEMDSGSVLEPEILCTPSAAKIPKLRPIRPKNPQREASTEENSVSEPPFMTFLSDHSAVTEDKSAYFDDLIAQNCEALESSDSSQYVILKRSVWKATEERLQRHFIKSQGLNNHDKAYNELLEENEKLKERLANVSQGAAGGVMALKARLAEVEDRNLVLSSENRALRRDKEKLETRSKKHAMLLKQFFTTGQLKRMFCEDPQRKFRWTPEDIAEALLIKSQSIPAYRILQNKFGFLLPDLSTLRRWVKKKKKMIEDRVTCNPSEPPSEEDRAVENLILLHDQTTDADENAEEDEAGCDLIEITIEHNNNAVETHFQ